MGKHRFIPWMILIIVVIVATPLLLGMAVSDVDFSSQSMMLPNASLVAVLLTVPAMYLLRGPFDQQ